MTKEYPLGTSIKVSGAFSDTSRAAIDPSTVTCLIQEPDGTETAYVYGTDEELVKDATGRYHIWLVPTNPGLYRYRFKGEGGVNVAKEHAFYVTGSRFSEP